MPALNQNLNLGANRSAIIVIPITDQNGAPYDLSGGNAEWAMAQSPNGPALVTKSVANGGLVLQQVGPLWQAVISLLPADTTTCEAGDYVHQLDVQNSLGNVVLATVGKIKLFATINQF